MKPAFTLLLGLALILPSAFARTFTDNAGRKVEAELVAVENDTIRIRRADGQVFTLPLATLSAADQTFVQQWKAKAPMAAPAGAKPAAAAKDAEAEQRRMLRILEDCVLPKWHDGNALRWEALPTLRLNSKDPELGKFVEDTFKDICATAGLQPAPGERISEIHIGPHEIIKKLATKEKEAMSVREGISYYVHWDDRKVPERTVLMLSTDKFPANELKATLVSYMLGTFGMEWSKELDPSEMCCLSWFASGAEKMSDLDRKLLAFFYQHVPNGANRSELRSIFRKKWQP
ncbi:MAG: hypothetical protein IPK22_10835 [Verrucomicrobiaceae bacterium]|nr:hypothetical protein [Verrucomicrobiaceae bacterium]